MILKSFIRNLNTKIYIIIFTILIVLLSFIYYSYENSLNTYNNSFDGSYIIVNNYDNSLDNDIVSKVGIIYKDNKTYMLDYSLNDDEIAISNKYNNEDISNICLNDCANYNIIFRENDDSRTIYISKKIFDEYNNNQFKLIPYRWDKKESLKKKLSDLNIDYTVYLNQDDINIKNIIRLYRLFVIILTILFILVFILNIKYIFVDNQSKNNMYSILGYSRLKIDIYNILKLLFIVICSTIISIPFILLIKIFI
jgi:hypothetical protein